MVKEIVHPQCVRAVLALAQSDLLAEERAPCIENDVLMDKLL